MTKPLEERFWEKVDKTSSTHFYNGTRCWEWTGGRNKVKNGYGAIRNGNRKKITAHRLSWILAFGDIPQLEGSDWRGTCVLHHCDNPICVRPDHLFVGTHIDNMKDMSKKGRHAVVTWKTHV